MNTTKYDVFFRAVQLGSLSKAAEELGYTQSGVSHMMKSLEREVGFPLFIRTAAGISPTASGELLLPYIRELLLRNEHLEQTVAAIKGLETGTIRIASFSSVAIFWLPTILKTFEEQHPGIEIDINEGGVDKIEYALETGMVDLAIFAKSPSTAFDWIPLREDPLYAALPPGHPLAGQAFFPAEALSDEQFIAPSRGFDYDIHRVLDGLERFPEIKFTSQNDYAIVSMVSSGLGMSILPGLILQGSMHPVQALPLRPAYSRILGIGVPRLKDISPAARQFIKLLRKMAGPGGVLP